MWLAVEENRSDGRWVGPHRTLFLEWNVTANLEFTGIYRNINDC